MNFIKDFKNMFKQPLNLILIIISGAYLFYNNFPTGNFWRMMISIMPMVLVIASAIILQYKEKTLAAHGVLFFSGYLNGVTVFGRTLLSYNFTFKTMASFATVLKSFFFMVISLYLLLIILSYLLNKDYELKHKKSAVWTSALIAFIYFYVRDGFSLALLKLISPIIALLFGYEFISVSLLLAGVIDIPFDIVDDIYSKFMKFNSIHTFIFWAIGLYLLVTAILTLIKMIKNPFEELVTEEGKLLDDVKDGDNNLVADKEEDLAEAEENEEEDFVEDEEENIDEI